MGSFSAPLTATFNGTSQYAQDLQNVINRALTFASYPLQQLSLQQQTLSAKVSAAQSLQGAITAVSASLKQLSPSNAALSTSVSDPSVVQATAASGALPGTYTINVTDPGSSTVASSSNTLPKVTDPASQSISASSSFTLTVGSTSVPITPSANNLNALATAINSSGAGIQATVINIGPPNQPDYRLALQSASLGSVALQLNDGTSNLLSTLSTGTPAVYTVNGQPSGGISSSSSTVTVAPGLTASLQDAGTSTIKVSYNESSISDALTSFVNAFNSAQAELQKSYGQNAGPLSGDSMVLKTSSALSSIINYSGSGAIQSLSQIGIEFTQTGTLTFDPSRLQGMSAGQLGDVLSFLGDPSTGGFLQAATNTFNGLLDPTNGALPNEISILNQQVTRQSQQIQSQQDKLTQLQNTLTQQMSAADALIASLEQQTSFLTSLFNTMNANNFAGR